MVDYRPLTLVHLFNNLVKAKNCTVDTQNRTISLSQTGRGRVHLDYAVARNSLILMNHSVKPC